MENYKVYKLKEFDVFIDFELKTIFVEFKKSMSDIIIHNYEGVKEHFIYEFEYFLINELDIVKNTYNLIKFTSRKSTLIYNVHIVDYCRDAQNENCNSKKFNSIIQKVIDDLNVKRRVEHGYF